MANCSALAPPTPPSVFGTQQQYECYSTPNAHRDTGRRSRGESLRPIRVGCRLKKCAAVRARATRSQLFGHFGHTLGAIKHQSVKRRAHVLSVRGRFWRGGLCFQGAARNR